MTKWVVYQYEMVETTALQDEHVLFLPIARTRLFCKWGVRASFLHTRWLSLGPGTLTLESLSSHRRRFIVYNACLAPVRRMPPRAKQ
jgi:hypothetical protein